MNINPRSFIREHSVFRHVVPEPSLSCTITIMSSKKSPRVFGHGSLKRRRRSDARQMPKTIGLMGTWFAD